MFIEGKENSDYFLYSYETNNSWSILPLSQIERPGSAAVRSAIRYNELGSFSDYYIFIQFNCIR